MKATELLKEFEDIINSSSENGEYGKATFHFNLAIHSRFLVAIKELEELKNRSCATCKYGRSFHFDKDIECMKLYDATQGLCFEKDFYCKNWELK